MTASEILTACIPLFGGFVIGVFFGATLIGLMAASSQEQRKQDQKEKQEGKDGDN